ncbi:MAG: DUF502 domain-containing protein [Burkholderiales bacterium]|nr:DUF502 domain-containing protein [Burkholderiales bacterium]
MKALGNTFIAGILLLLPIMVAIIVVREVVRMLRQVVEPLAKLLPFERILGVQAENVASLLVLLAFCMLAGLFATTATGRRITLWLERHILQYLPLYGWAMTMVRNLLNTGSDRPTEVVLLDIGDGIEQVAWVTGRPVPGKVVVYVPDPPDGQSGAVFLTPEGKIRPAGLTMIQALDLLRRLGGGSTEMAHRRSTGSGIDPSS